MTWQVELSSAAVRQVRRLPDRVVPAVIELMAGGLTTMPERLSKQLHDDFAGLRSARRGDYRILFRLYPERTTVLVVRVAHRSQAYRPPAP